MKRKQKRKHLTMTALLALLLAAALTLGACQSAADEPDANGSAQQGQETPDTQETQEMSEAPETQETQEMSETPDTPQTPEDTPSVEEGSQEDGGQDGNQDAPEQKDTAYPVTVTDQLGREVVIQQEPQKIVSGYYISSSLLIALGQAERMVGIEAKADSRPIYSLAAPKLLELPNVGTAKEFDLEGCAALKPDLVIVPAKLKDSIAAMEELGMTVLAVNPEDQELFTEMAKLLGTATNTKEQAVQLVARAEEYLAQLQEAVKKEDAPSVYLAGNSALLSTAGEAMYQHTLIMQAGGKNVAAELTDAYWAEISYEQLLAWNPDYIILAADADYAVEDVLQDPQLQECAAVQNGQVYQIPGTIEAWDSPVPGSVMGSLWLGSVLHPEQYSPEKYKQAVTDFYKEFYGVQAEL